MEHRGDAVRHHLPVGIDECHVDREIDAGPRHHLPLETVAMDVDDAGQNQQAGGVDAQPRRARLADAGDHAGRGIHLDAGFDQRVADEDLSAFDPQVRRHAGQACVS